MTERSIFFPLKESLIRPLRSLGESYTYWVRRLAYGEEMAKYLSRQNQESLRRRRLVYKDIITRWEQGEIITTREASNLVLSR